MTLPVFVYGTLMTGGAQAGLLAGLSRVQGTVRGALWDLPAGYPAIGPGDGVVHGELVEAPGPRLLALLDQYEGVDESRFERTKIDVTVGLRTVQAWVWGMPDPRIFGGRRVPDGRWRPVRRRG